MERLSGSNEQEANFKVDAHNWKGEITILLQTLEALEGATQDASVGMASSHNPTAFASSAASFT